MFLFLAALGSPAILGIDLGYATTKVSVATRSTPLHIALNSDGERSTPAYFAFWNRSKPSETRDLFNWKPQTSLHLFDWSIGRRAKDYYFLWPSVGFPGRMLTNYTYFTLMGYETTALALAQLVDSIVATEGLNESITLAFSLASKMRSTEKAYLAIACRIAGFPVAGFIDALAAPAEVYALEHGSRFNGTRETVAFVDIGSRGTRCAIYTFDGTGEVPIVTQLAGKYVEDVGGMDLERRMALSLAGKYRLNLDGMRTKVNIMGDCEAVKEALTEIPATEFRFTAMKDADDRTVRVKLKDLLDISEEMNDTITNVVAGAFSEAGIDKVDRVEVVGGSIRVPFIQEAISNAFAGAELQWTLDTEGFAAVAAGYVAARKSPEFTVRKIHKTDFLTAPALLMTRGENISLFAAGTPRDTIKVVNLNPRPGQTFVIGTDWNDAYFVRFKLKHKRQMNISLAFAIDDFLNPYVINATGPDGLAVQIEFETLDWDVPPEALKKSTEKVKQMIEMRKARAESERQEAPLREYLTRLTKVAETNAQLPAKQKSRIQSAVQATEKWLGGLKKFAPADEHVARLQSLQTQFEPVLAEFDVTPSVYLTKLPKQLAKGEELVWKARNAGGVDVKILEEAAKEVSNAMLWFETEGNNAEVHQLKARSQRVKQKLLALRQSVQLAEIWGKKADPHDNL